MHSMETHHSKHRDGHHSKHHDGHHSKHAEHKYSDSHMKPDKTHHKPHQDMGTEAKKAKLPGQMYVPQKDHNESRFAGEER